MLRIIARKYRSLTKPLLTLWLLCSSVLVCAVTMNDADATVVAHHLSADAELVKSRSVQKSSMNVHCLQSKVGLTDISQINGGYYCCDNAEPSLSAKSNLSDSPVFVIFVLYLVFSVRLCRRRLSRIRIGEFSYLTPSLSILNCVFLK